MTVTLGARALLQRVARGETTDDDAKRLHQWLFPGEQTEIVKAYLLLCCNAEKVKAYIAADLRLNLAMSLLGASDDSMDRLELRTVFADAIHLYNKYREQHGFKPSEARDEAIANTLTKVYGAVEVMKEREP